MKFIGKDPLMKCLYQGCLWAIFFMVGFTAEKGSAPTHVDKPQNVLFIMVDDLNKALGTYGHELVQSPHVDSLAAMGIQFENAHCNYSVCNPSRTSLLTGLRPETTGVLNNDVSIQSILGDRVTLPALFKRNGYHTVNIGKIFHGPVADHNDMRAWDEFYFFGPTELGKQGEKRNFTGDVMSWCYWQAAEGSDEDQADGQTALKAVEIIKRKSEKPLFLAVGLTKPHDPYIAPKKYFDQYPLEKMELPAVPSEWAPAYEYAFPLETPVFPQGKSIFNSFSEQDKREFLRAYYACITFMDAQLGKILNALEATGQLENTHIIFFSDHGYHLGDHDWWNKFTLYELSTSSPFIVAGPSVKQKGSKTEAMIEFIDVFPTLAALLNLKMVPDYLEGRNFERLLKHPNEPFRTHVRAVTTRKGGIMGKSVRNMDWLYIEWEEGRMGRELYDLENDPLEYTNLAEQPRYTSLVRELKELIE